MEILPKCIDFIEVGGNNSYFEYIADILNMCFGASVAGWQKATWPIARDIAVKDSKMKAFVWMPKFYRNRSLWKNSISGDGNYIYETADYDRNEDWMNEDGELFEQKYRIVFVKEMPETPYRFVGVFEDYKTSTSKPRNNDNVIFQFINNIGKHRVTNQTISMVMLDDCNKRSLRLRVKI